MKKTALRRRSPHPLERSMEKKEAPSKNRVETPSLPKSSKVDFPPNRSNYIRIHSTSRLKGDKPLVPEDAPNAFTRNLRRTSVLRIETAQNDSQQVIKRRLLLHGSRHEGTLQPKQQDSPPDFRLTILRLLGVEKAQREAISKLPIRQAREAYAKILEEHPQEVENLGKVLDPIWKEVWGEVFEEAASKPRREETILSWTEYEQGYQTDKKEVLEALCEGDPEALFYYLPFYGPRLLAEGPVLAVVQAWWFERIRNEKARENWRELLAVLAWEGQGRFKELGPEDRQQYKRDAVSQSTVARALLKKYERYKEQGESPLNAYNLMKRQHEENTRIKDPDRKKRAFQSFKKRALDKDPSLRKALSAKGRNISL